MTLCYFCRAEPGQTHRVQEVDGCPNGPRVWSLVFRALERKYKEKNRIPSAQLKIREKSPTCYKLQSSGRGEAE